MEAPPEDMGSEPGTGGTAETSTQEGGLSSLRVVYNLSKACECQLCNSKSTDDSPLAAAVGGSTRRPWRSYKKVKDRVSGETVKVPEGKLCLLCFNVYRMLGLDAKYGKVKEYVKKVIVDKTDKQSNRSNFLSALKTWIDEHNQNPDMVRLKDKDAVMKAHTTLTTSKTMGSRLKAPKRLFILKEDWNEQKYGPLSEQKISERDVFGVRREGVYRLAGEQGHYEVEDFDESALTEQTVEHDGEGPLAEQGLENRREAFQSAFRHASAEQEAGASKAQVLDMESVLAALQNHGSPAESAASKAGPKSEAAEPNVAEGEEEEQESSEDIAATDRLTRGLVKKKKSEAKPKAKAAASFRSFCRSCSFCGSCSFEKAEGR